jgi:hypothetical protein
MISRGVSSIEFLVCLLDAGKGLESEDHALFSSKELISDVASEIVIPSTIAHS